MINASKEFKEKLREGANIVNYADVTLVDGTVLHLGPKDFMVGGCSIEDKTTDGKFGVGFCIGKTLTAKLANHDERFSQYDFYGATIHLYVALLLDDGTIEKIRKGVYYVIVPSTPGDIIEISAVDGMYRLDKDYSGSTTSYPATLQTILADACLDCGIPIGFRQFDNMSYTVQSKPETTTYRQVFSWACQIAGYNARIDNAGYMQLIWYKSALLEQYNYVGGDFRVYPHDTILDGGDFKDYSTETIISGQLFSDEMPEHIFRIKSLDVHTDDVQITGVRVVGDEDASELFGEEGYVIEVKDNPFSAGKEQAVADYLGGRMVGMMFRPFSAQVLGNPLYEPFDIVRVSDRKGNVYYSLINSVSYTVGAYTQIACEAEDLLRNGSTYFSEAAAAVVEARRNTEKQFTTYDKAVQNMNQLAANAMGLYREADKQVDGSHIYYQSNRPITIGEDGKCHFEENSVVYKSGAEGFFVSTNGGESFTSGFDAQGNAVVNVLSAIGITFDWAKGGVLTLGGADNINGSLQVLDSLGNIFCNITKDGMDIRSNRLTVDSENFKLSGSGAVSAKGEIETTKENGFSAKLKGSGITMFSPVGIEMGGLHATGNLSNLSDSSKYGVGLETGSAYVAIGVNAGTNMNTYYYMNNGLNPNGLTERHLFNKEARFINAVKAPKLFLANATSEYGNLTGGNYDGAAVFCNGSFYAYGSIGCSGTKYRIVDTKNYGTIGMNAFETAGAYFSDIGSGHIEVDKCYIYFDPIFLEVIDIREEYQVLITRTSQPEVSWVEKHEDYFVVHGESGASFDWMVIAKQKGYQADRMESAIIENKDEIPYDESIFYEDDSPQATSERYMYELEDTLEEDAMQYIRDFTDMENKIIEGVI